MSEQSQEKAEHERDSRRADALLEMIAREEKADHELDIRRADEWDAEWQEIHRRNLATMLGIIERERHVTPFDPARRAKILAQAEADAPANPPAPAEPNAHVAHPLSDVLNKFAGWK